MLDLSRARDFRNALASFATGVTIVTTREGDTDIGITANSFNSVSLDPPMVLWSLAKKARSLPAFVATSHFAVHVLAADQQDLSERFAIQAATKFDGLNLARGDGYVPLLKGCAALFQCKNAFRYDGGDHIIFVGEVIDFVSIRKPPLLFHDGEYVVAVQKRTSNLDSSAEVNASADAELDGSFSQDLLISLLDRATFQMMSKFQDHLDSCTLDEEEWSALAFLAIANHQSVADLSGLLGQTGRYLSFASLARLASVDYVTLRGGHDPATRVTLTDAGRAIVIQLAAVATALEMQVAAALGPNETQLIKQLLRSIIRKTSRDAPRILVRRSEDT